MNLTAKHLEKTDLATRKNSLITLENDSLSNSYRTEMFVYIILQNILGSPLTTSYNVN